jgi:hypothetical protein
MQQTMRANYDSEMHDKDLAVQKTDQTREKRQIEKTEDGSKPELDLKHEDDTTRKNILENGNIIVEQYDEDGNLVRKTPPGYMPFGEMA